MEDISQKTKRQITYCQKLFPKHISNKGSILKLYQITLLEFGKC